MRSLLEIPKVNVGSEVETWLAAQTVTAPENPIFWKPRWSRTGTSIRGTEHLAVLISSLKLDSFAGVEADHSETPRWGQVLKTDPGWIVEVHDGTSDDFASRVFRGPFYRDQDALWTQMFAAKILLAWVHGSLIEGCFRKRMYPGACGIQTARTM